MPDASTRQVIAVITDAFAPYHQMVVDSLRPHFSAAGYGTLAVAGRDVQTDQLVRLANYTQPFTGSLGTHLNVRGAVVVSGAAPPDMSDDEVARYVERLTDGPVISFGLLLPGVPSVTVAWDQAIIDLMDHVTADPARRRFVFIRGFAGDPHSKIREAGFRAGIQRAGISVDERLVIRGNYSVADSMQAVSELLDAGHCFDGVIAANDDMAVGAIAALGAAGFSIPGDVIVAGFDDSLAAFTSEPPLTSVRLDTAGKTKATADLLLNALDSNLVLHPDLEVQIDSCLVKRESTRTTRLQDDLKSDQIPPNIEQYLEEQILTRWEVDRAPEYFAYVNLAKAAVQTLLTGDGAFTRALEKAWSNLPRITNKADALWVRHAVRQLRTLSIEVESGEVAIAGLRAILKQLVAVDEWRSPVEKLIETERHAHRQRQERLVMMLATCSDLESLWATLRTGLGSIGMRNAWVATNDDEQPSAEDANTTMQLAFSLSDQELPDSERFSRENVLPERFRHVLEHDVHVLVPLRAGDSDIGYMVLEPRGEYLVELEAIASGIAQVLRHVGQVGNLEHQAARLRLANEALDHLARRDSLTGLANRKMFLERLEQEIDSVTDDEEVNILFFDLDGFKHINDTLGHESGDHLLRIVSNRAGGLISDKDTLARLGGDEFIIILRHAKGSTRSTDVAHALLTLVSDTCIISGQKTKISASLGIAKFPQDGVTTDELVRNADAAMYAAKGAGKNRFSYYSKDLPGENDSEVELREALRVGLDNDEFYLEYQPRICLASGKVQAFEALLRWDPSSEIADEDRRPDRFVVVAERNGLIAALDSVSLDRACREARRWADGGHPIPVSVNMSVKRLQEADIAAQVVDALERHGLPPELLELELSEQALVNDLAASRSKLQSVRETGVRCSIDDYGTGNTSVVDLAELPLDIVKIDGSVVARIDDETDAGSEAGRRNVRAILAVSASLGLTAVAEGIETAAQLQFLQDIGCAQGQGFELNRNLVSLPEGARDVWPALPYPSGDPEPSPEAESRQKNDTHSPKADQALGAL